MQAIALAESGLSTANIENLPIIKERELVRERQNINLNKLVCDIANKQEEFILKLEKLTWNNFFKVVKYITALFLFRSRGENLTAKYKKAKLSHYIETLKTFCLCNTVVAVVIFLENRLIYPST